MLFVSLSLFQPGLVNINGDVATIKLDMKSEADRLGRLEAALAGGAEPEA